MSGAQFLEVIEYGKQNDAPYQGDHSLPHFLCEHLGTQDNILNYLIAGGDLSLYGLSNAITRASQDVENYDRATALEGIGWQVATMEPAQWKEINS